MFKVLPLMIFTFLSWANPVKVSRGLSTDYACQKSNPESDCVFDSIEQSLLDLIENATTNECLALSSLNSENLPKCDEKSNKLKGLSNVAPTGAIVITYTPNTSIAIGDLIKDLLAKNSSSKINIAINKSEVDSLKKDEKLLKIINNPRVNIIYFRGNSVANVWIQDFMEFTTIYDKPAVYQLMHPDEDGKKYSNRIACEIAKACDLPYFIPEEVAKDPYEGRNMDMGGNLEVLPGGTFVTGTQQSQGGYQEPNSRSSFFGARNYRASTKNQIGLEESLEDNENRLIELDITSFRTGHVDEVFNIVKTNKEGACDFVVLMSSPLKAFELMEKNNVKSKKHFCKEYKYSRLQHKKDYSENEVQKIYNENCINGYQVSEFLELSIIDTIRKDARRHHKIMIKNRERIAREIRKTTSCKDPIFMEVPVFTLDSHYLSEEHKKKGGVSYLTNLTNGLVYTPEKGASSIISPRTFYKPFDDYLSEELGKYGVDVTYVNDLELHTSGGGVHCLTNSIRLCK